MDTAYMLPVDLIKLSYSVINGGYGSQIYKKNLIQIRNQIKINTLFIIIIHRIKNFFRLKVIVK